MEANNKKPNLVHVHWHVTKQIYSISESGKPVRYTAAVELEDVRFHVDARLRRLFEEKTSRRTVHALIKGRIVNEEPAPIADGILIRCNPFEFAGFRDPDGNSVDSANRVACYADRRMVAVGVK